MLKNYVVTAFRYLWHQKMYAVLNVVGLAVAVASSLMIFLYVFDEFSYDRFYEEADRILRVAAEVDRGDEEPFLDYYTPPETPALFSEIPEVETVVRFAKAHGPVIRRGETLLQSETIYATDNYFDVFSHEFLAGDPQTALEEQYSVVLTDSFATRYFGEEPALGKTLLFYQDDVFNDQPFTVTGVIRNVPRNTSFNVDMVLPVRSNPHYSPENTSMAAFLLLHENASVEIIGEKLERLQDKYFGAATRHEGRMRLRLQPLTDVHLDPPLDREWIPGGAGGNMQNLLILMAVGAFLVLIACVNYMNLATARASKRAREIGVRKVAGASRRQLIGQHLAESMGLTMIAFFIAAGLCILCLPILNDITDKSISLAYLTRGPVLLALAGSAVLIGLGSGMYPAVYMTAYSPITALKGAATTGRRGLRFRNGLVVSQFAVSVAMIVFAIVVHRQLEYMQSKDLGFDRESVLVIDNTAWLGDQQVTFMDELKRNSQVVEAGYVQSFPGRLWNVGRTAFYRRQGEVPAQGEEQTEAGTDMNVYLGDDGFLPTLGIEIVTGRNFFEGNSTDTSSVLLNVAAARSLNVADPVGNQLYRRHVSWSQNENGDWRPHSYVKEYQVIGVIEDFHHYPLQQEIEPMAVFPASAGLASAVVRIGPGNVERLLSSIEELWTQVQPKYPFVYYFLDEQFAATYRKDVQFGRLARFFTALSILIACLGVVGLATFTAQRRTKEIGIRKAHGASVNSILALLCRDAVRWVIIACVIGLPLGYLVVQKWLANFAYRIDISVLTFLIAALTALLFALFSVILQTMRAATSNPADVLRYE